MLRTDGGGVLRDWIFREACQIDLNAWVKHKYLARYDDISDEDRQYFDPTLVERIVREEIKKMVRRAEDR